MPRRVRVLAQETHDDRLAVQHRDDGDADVDLGIVDADLDAAVLRQALFGDVQVAEDFDAGHDRRLEALDLGRHRHLLQHAVDAVPDAQFVLERFEVDVGGAQLDRILQDLVDEADDRGVLGGIVEVVVLDDPSSSTTWRGPPRRACRWCRRPRRAASSSRAGSPRRGKHRHAAAAR
jgi:hypothetical protein